MEAGLQRALFGLEIVVDASLKCVFNGWGWHAMVPILPANVGDSAIVAFLPLMSQGTPEAGSMGHV
jgi:hypothetical protein